ncbi:MAG: hypothetical protein ACOVP7_08515, partial [Lacibacter sp.]
NEATLVLKQKKQNGLKFQEADEVLQSSKEEINKLSTAFYNTAEQSWNELLTKKHISQKTIKQISKLSRQLVKLCRSHAAVVYPYCGLAKTSEQSELNRVFRDLFTASQHALLTYGE